MDKIVLYSTGCPKCTVLKTKLDAKNINYELVTDTEVMLAKGFNFMPVLEIGDKIMEFSEAVHWVNSQEAQS